MYIENPKEIYEHLNDVIADIETRLEDTGSKKVGGKFKKQTSEFEISKTEFLDLIRALRNTKINKEIEMLENAQEWDDFTVAFYGETNAGKSTIIEVLRIYFQEETKAKQQAEFKKHIQAYEHQLEQYNKLIQEHEDAKKDLENQIKNCSIDKKADSFIGKILSFIGLSSYFRKKKIAKLQIDISKVESNIRNIESDIEAFKSGELKNVEKFADGQIIGDGRSDFTKTSTAYNFIHDSQSFVFLDVPGTEGHDKSVKNEISQAVKKAHAVFYVTSSVKPPEKGDDGRSGTLEKMKEHLGAQTEVYTIFNKRITNPLQLKDALLSEDETKTLKQSDKIISEILNDEKMSKNYVGHKTIAARPAFLAIAECLPSESQANNEKQKFLSEFSTEDLKEKTNLNSLCDFITGNLVVDTKYKIKKSNYNKAYKILREFMDALETTKNILQEKYDDLCKLIDNTKQNIESTSDSTKNQLKQIPETQLHNFETNTREKIYKKIDYDIKDSEANELLKEFLEDNFNEMMKENIPKAIKEMQEKFQNEIQDDMKTFGKKFKSLDYGQINVGGFNIDLTTSANIDKMALLGSLAGAGGLAYTAIAFSNSWNPLGWTMFAIGVAGVLIGLGKAFLKLVSSSYKKSEQKKAADKAIESVVKDIRPKLKENLEPIEEKIDELIESIKKELSDMAAAQEKVIEYIEDTHTNLGKTAQQIKKEGERHE